MLPSPHLDPSGGIAIRRLALALLASLAIGTTALPTPAAAAGLTLSLVESGLSDPLFVTNAGDSRLFVVERGGRIKIVGGGTFLDISGLVAGGSSERGLLGLAFHPDYDSNGLFYVDYTRAGDGATVIAEYSVSAGDPDTADAGSGRVVLTIAQPYSNHNGGWLGFKGQLLYISTGDGGSGGDPRNRAQSKNVLLGKILRINPLDPDGGGPATYTIPTRNPYVGKSGRDEIWARGLRNPWRCSFDAKNGKLWCADVGQGKFEEINRVKRARGVNFGWRLLEGRHYYSYPGHKSGKLCTSHCRTLPIADYAHAAFGGGNCAVTGGYVARRSGAAIAGRYVFGDYCSGRIWTIPASFASGSTLPPPALDTGLLISSFGQGADGRLYVVDLGGAVYRINES